MGGCLYANKVLLSFWFLFIAWYYPILSDKHLNNGRQPLTFGSYEMWDYIKAVNEAALDDMQNDAENIASIVDEFGACAVDVYNLIDARRKMES